jgi:hypothetical protein
MPPVTALKSEAVRIDRVRGTALSTRIAEGLDRRDTSMVEAALQRMFAFLLDEILLSIRQRFDDPVTAGRLFPHARRYYAEALEASLTLRHPLAATQANSSLAAMSRALDEAKTGSGKARNWFERERQQFMQSIVSSVGEHSHASL